MLIEKGIEASLIPHGSTDKPPEEIVSILKDQEEALQGVFEFVKRNRELSTAYIKELHQVLTRHQNTVQAINGLGRLVELELIHGEWKKHPNNPKRPDGETHEYCPPEHVAAEMDHLIEMHRQHTKQDVPPEVEAAWLHHRFTQIHPFQDGNGRIARALASLIFLRSNWFPLVINRDQRSDYIIALEQADNGNLTPLVSLFSNIQKSSFLKAFSISEKVLEDFDPVSQVIASAKDKLKKRHEAQLLEKRKVFNISMRLENMTFKHLEQIGSTLDQELKELSEDYISTVDQNDQNTDFWFRKQIIETAKKLGYYADTRTYRSWVRLKIKEERQAELVFAFHALGVEFLGIMAASAFMEYRDRSEGQEPTLEGPYVICKEVFQFSYNENQTAVEKRFGQWLNEVTLTGLDQWRRQL